MKHLTQQEKDESMMTTIGRLRTILKGYSKSSKERTLELFEKVTIEASDIEIRLMRYESPFNEPYKVSKKQFMLEQKMHGTNFN